MSCFHKILLVNLQVLNEPSRTKLRVGQTKNLLLIISVQPVFDIDGLDQSLDKKVDT